MTTRRIIAAIVTFLHVLCWAATSTATTPFFWDTFERENLFESSVGWSDEEPPREEAVSIVDGSLEVRPLQYSGLNFPGIRTDIGQYLSSFRIEAAIRLVDADSVFMFTSMGDSEVGRFEDWSGFTSDGQFTVGVTERGNITWNGEPAFASEDEVRVSDVHISAELKAGTQTLTVWLDGQEADAMTFADRRVTDSVDWVYIGMNPGQILSQSILVRHFAVLPLIDGDYNASGDLDVGDIDLMADQLRSPDPERVRVFDVNGDGETNATDYADLVTQLFGTSLGDANLDGNVAFDDFLVLSAGFGNDGNWSDGDFDANGQVEFDDFLLLSQNFGSEQAVASVPEPSGVHLGMLCAIAAIYLRGKCRRA